LKGCSSDCAGAGAASGLLGRQVITIGFDLGQQEVAASSFVGAVVMVGYFELLISGASSIVELASLGYQKC
jgi:hypothetical protein